MLSFMLTGLAFNADLFFVCVCFLTAISVDCPEVTEFVNQIRFSERIIS